MMNAETMSLLRSVLMLVGGFLMTKGWLTQDQLSVLVNSIVGAIGAICTFGAVVWSLYHVVQQRRANAVSAATGTPTAVRGFAMPTIQSNTASTTSLDDLAKVRSTKP